MTRSPEPLDVVIHSEPSGDCSTVRIRPKSSCRNRRFRPLRGPVSVTRNSAAPASAPTQPWLPTTASPEGEQVEVGCQVVIGSRYYPPAPSPPSTIGQP